MHQLDESYTSFLTWHPKWSWCCQAREGPLRDSRVRRRAGVAAPMGTTRSDGATAMKREAGECTANTPIVLFMVCVCVQLGVRYA